jgi:hypothetical protein
LDLEDLYSNNLAFYTRFERNICGANIIELPNPRRPITVMTEFGIWQVQSGFALKAQLDLQIRRDW